MEQQSPWASPNFAHRFEALVQFTNRPSLIQQLLDVDVPDKALRRHIREVEQRFNIKRSAPKGRPPSFTNPKILRSVREKYHASVMYALLNQVGIEASVATGNFLEHLLEVYQKYLQVTGSRLETAALDFETFLEVVHAVSRNLLQVMDCADCGAQHVVKHSDTHNAQRECPFCQLHDHASFNISGILTKYQSQELESVTRKRSG